MNREMLMVKYYTNIDMDDYQDEEGRKRLYDYLTGKGIIDEIYKAIMPDEHLVTLMADNMLSAVKEVYNQRNSISFVIRDAFMKMMDNEENADALAKAQSTTKTMMDMYQALQEKEAQEKTLKAGKANKVKVGGTIVNLAKR